MADVRGKGSSNNSQNTDDNSDVRPNSAVAANSPGGEVEGNAAPNQQQQRQPTGMESFLSITKSLIVRGLVIYFITSFFRRPQPTTIDPNAPPGSVKGPYPASNLFDNGSIYDLYFYVSEDFGDINLKDKKAAQFIHLSKGLVYGDWTGGPYGDGSERFQAQIKASKNVQNNGSLYLHVYATLQGNHPSEDEYTSHNWKQLNRFKKRRYTKTVNLLTGQTAATPEEVKKAENTKVEVTSHWHPNITVNIVTDQTKWAQGSVPPPLDEYIQFLPGGAIYKPTLYFNEFWNMLRDYQPINDTTEVLDLDVTFQPLSLFRWQLYTALGMRNKWTNMLGEFAEEEEDEEQDSLKEVLSENSVYLLALTVAVSLLHSVFELLAFKNDIQFWNNRKSLEGLSVRSVFFNVFQSLIVLLYVLDNGTNTMVRISCFIGLLIELWKIHKVLDIQIDRENKIAGLIPRVLFKDKGSYTDSSTKEYDTLAFKYLSWALYPLLGGYAVYSLMYNEHRGWYSFVLNMLYGFLLTFGFIMMTPQLFINYKMKSVAHLPWRMLSYKFLNTFIDDIFAFVIKMPTMYRLGCFRDDIVFCIFLYQRYIYKTDPTRVNEFGFSAEMEEELAAKKESEKRAVGGVAAIEESPAAAASAAAASPTASSSNKSKSKHVAKDKVSKKKD